jgi:hypothetical protein
MSKIFVIAGTYQEAQDWIAKNYQERAGMGDQQVSVGDYKYVSHADDVKGYTNPHGVFVGNWLGRPDIFEIVEALMMRSTHVNKALGKIYNQVKPKVRPTPKIVSGYQANIDHAGLLMAQAIDEEVLKSLTRRINGGII